MAFGSDRSRFVDNRISGKRYLDISNAVGKRITVCVYMYCQSCGRQKHWTTSQDDYDPMHSLYQMCEVRTEYFILVHTCMHVYVWMSMIVFEIITFLYICMHIQVWK